MHAVLAMSEHLPRQAKDAETTGHRDGLMPVVAHLAGWETLAVGLHQLSVDCRPLCLECSAQYRLANLDSGSLQGIQRSLGERGSIGPRKVDCGALSLRSEYASSTRQTRMRMWLTAAPSRECGWCHSTKACPPLLRASPDSPAVRCGMPGGPVLACAQKWNERHSLRSTAR